MDSATKPSKPSSNISDIINRFVKVCRLRSIGVFSSEKRNHHNHRHNTPSTEDSSDATEETECHDQRIHPQSLEESLIKTHEDASATVIMKLFNTISALKLAYIQLQEAHIPYNPEKIQAADGLVVSELKTLCYIKQSYKHVTKPKSNSSLSGPLLLEEIQYHTSQLEKFESQIQAKDTKILQLQQELEELDRKNSELDVKIKRKSLEEENARHCRDLTGNSFVDAFNAAMESIQDFAKPLISLMKASGWDLDLAVNSIEDSIVYSKRSHKKYAFEAYLSRRMFHDFSLQSHDMDDLSRFKDPFDALIEDPNSNFAKFCGTKYLLIVHSRMEASFCGNLDQRAFVLRGGHPRTPLYQSCVRMVKCVWTLQAMATLIEPKAEIFGVQRGSEFSEVYMESVVEDEDHTKPNSEGRFRVGYMVMPGFRIGKTVIKSRVFLSSVNSSNGAC